MATAENLSLSVVVPVYKEEKNVPKFLERIRPALASLGNYEIIFCMDPSPDATEKVIRDECALDSRISLLTFCRRVGQPAATMAGVFNCRGAACVVIDVDLQDPPELIPTMAARMADE